MPNLNQDSSQDPHFAIAVAERLVQLVNESVRLAADSENADTQISRLDFAGKKLVELKQLVLDHPFLQLTQLAEVEKSIRELEIEFARRGLRAAVEGNLRGQVLEKEGRVEDALAEYESLLLARVDTPFTYRRLAIIYAKRKDRANEIRVLRAAIDNIPSKNDNDLSWFAERLARKE